MVIYEIEVVEVTGVAVITVKVDRVDVVPAPAVGPKPLSSLFVNVMVVLDTTMIDTLVEEVDIDGLVAEDG